MSIGETGIRAGFVRAMALVVRGRDRGSGRFFRNQTYHFATLRALNSIPYDGADTGEILETVKHITTESPESWYAEWLKTAHRVEALAEETADMRSKGRAYLRAHTYFRTAEFLLPSGDRRRKSAFEKSVGTFHKGLCILGVHCERIAVPYGAHHLNALYFAGDKGAADRPLIVAHGGFDSTMEEMYFVVGAAALERGYAVLLFEGPGQGSIIREQGLPFIKEWERPTGAVLDLSLIHI